jgi:hypothetical protein
MGSERVDLWMSTEANAIGEVNVRPMWMAEYDADVDGPFLLLEQGDSPGIPSWRAKNASSTLDQPYLSGTGFNGWWPVDNAHAWLYHVEDFYVVSANLWLQDWYEFIKEFRRSERSMTGQPNWSWLNKDGFYNNIRGEAHSWANLIAAYRLTGDPKVMTQIKSRMRKMWTHRQARYGNFNKNQEAAFQMGFMGRTMIQLMTEVRDGDPQLYAEAFNILWGILDWNRNMSGFGNYIDTEAAAPGATPSNPFATPMIAPVAWFGFNTGNNDYLDFVRAYLLTGLNGGQAARGHTKDWSADFYGYEATGGGLGRLGEYALTYTISPSAPTAIGDLTATRAGSEVKIDWTTPARAARFHVVWSTKPFTATYDRSDTVRNPWAGTPVGNALAGKPGTRQSLQFGGLPSGTTIYVAVFTFDAADTMSAMSNVASVTLP